MDQEFTLINNTGITAGGITLAVNAFGDFLYHLAVTRLGREPDALLLKRVPKMKDLEPGELGDILARAPGAVEASHIAFLEALYSDGGAMPELKPSPRFANGEQAIYFLAKPGSPAERAINEITRIQATNPHGSEVIITKGAKGKAVVYMAGAKVPNITKGSEVKQ